MFTQPQEVIAQFDIVPGMSVADFGVGTGHGVEALSGAVGKNGTIFAIDIQKEILDRLRNDLVQKGIDNVEIIWGDIEMPRGTKIKDQSIDRVVMTNTMFQIEDKVSVIVEMKRILKPGGKVLFLDWTDSHNGLGPIPENVFSKTSAKELFENNGFVVDHDVVTGEHHYGLVFRMKNI